MAVSRCGRKGTKLHLINRAVAGARDGGGGGGRLDGRRCGGKPHSSACSSGVWDVLAGWPSGGPIFPGRPRLRRDGPSGAVWVPAAQALQRDVWAAGHFECLAPLGLTEVAEGGLILPATLCALLEAAGSVDEPSDMVRAIQEATPGDGFLSEVLKSVQDSEEASWRDFFYDDQWRLLFYQRAGDANPRICVPSGCRAAVLREAHGGSVLAGTPALHAQLLK